MEKSTTFINYFSAYLAILAAGIILFPKLIGLFILMLCVFVFIGYYKKQLVFKLNPIAILFILFYLGYVVGAFFTHHPDWAQRYIENKLSFLLFPLLLSFQTKEKINFSFTFLSFIGATFLIVVLGFYHAVECYNTIEGGKHCFLASSISPLHHPTYLSVYLIFSVGLALVGLQQKMRGFSLYWVIPYSVFVILIHGLLLSLSGILFLFIALGVILMWWIYNKWGKIIFFLSLIFIPIASYMMLTTIPQIEGEWYNAKWYADQYVKNPSMFVKGRKYPMSGTEVRIVMWTASVRACSKNLLGVGTGNVDETLTKELIKLKQAELAKDELNPHNQFLQTLLEIGIVGFTILILIIGFGINFAFKYKNSLLLLLASNLFFNSLFESMLQRQSGIVFYSFWFCFLIIYHQHKNQFKHES